MCFCCCCYVEVLAMSRFNSSGAWCRCGILTKGLGFTLKTHASVTNSFIDVQLTVDEARLHTETLAQRSQYAAEKEQRDFQKPFQNRPNASDFKGVGGFCPPNYTLTKLFPEAFSQPMCEPK